eukprot:6600834-Heterocapsa_arctica.AAC.1
MKIGGKRALACGSGDMSKDCAFALRGAGARVLFCPRRRRKTGAREEPTTSVLVLGGFRRRRGQKSRGPMSRSSRPPT